MLRGIAKPDSLNATIKPKGIMQTFRHDGSPFISVVEAFIQDILNVPDFGRSDTHNAGGIWP